MKSAKWKAITVTPQRRKSLSRSTF
jgi:hypothetical protein